MVLEIWKIKKTFQPPHSSLSRLFPPT